MRRTDILNLLFEQAELTGARSFFQRKRREDLSLAGCLEPHRLDAILSNYGRRFGTTASRIAVAGEWSKRYFFFVALLMGPAILFFGRSSIPSKMVSRNACGVCAAFDTCWKRSIIVRRAHPQEANSSAVRPLKYRLFGSRLSTGFR